MQISDHSARTDFAVRWYSPVIARLGPALCNEIWSDWTDKLHHKEMFQLADFRNIVSKRWPHLAPKTIHDRTTALLAYFVELPSDLKRNPNGRGYVWRQAGELEELLQPDP